MFEFFQYTDGWLWYSKIFQQVCGPYHISEPSLSMVEKFKSDVLHFQYNSNIILINHYFKTQSELTEMLKNSPNLLNFLQVGAIILRKKLKSAKISSVCYEFCFNK